MWRRIALMGVLLCVLSRVALAETQDSGANVWSDAGWGVLTVLSNVAYIPAKVIYAGAGTVVGGLAYVLTIGDSDTAQKIWNPSLGGTYVVTPAMLRGDERVSFSGSRSSTD